jgi:hypothetical protein
MSRHQGGASPTLSDKEFGGDVRYGELLMDWKDCDGVEHKGDRAFWTKDVKEAIQKLKEILNEQSTERFDRLSLTEINKIIEDIFGTKLTEDKK